MFNFSDIFGGANPEPRFSVKGSAIKGANNAMTQIFSMLFVSGIYACINMAKTAKNKSAKESDEADNE